MALPQKLDRYAKALIQRTLTDRQQAETKTIGQDARDRLIAAALRRLHAEYDAAQPDMPTLLRYQLASEVGGMNLRVEGDDNRFTETFGVDQPMPGFFVPGPFNPYPSFYVRRRDPDFDAVWWVVEQRRTLQARHIEAQDQLRQAMRQSTSVRRLAALYPWIAEVA